MNDLTDAAKDIRSMMIFSNHSALRFKTFRRGTRAVAIVKFINKNSSDL